MPETAASADQTSRPDFLRPEAEPGSLSRDVIAHFRDIKGFFNEDDCMHFHLVLRTQSLLGFAGDILEIGSYFGRSAALLARCLQPGETLVACDAFERDTPDSYASTIRARRRRTRRRDRVPRHCLRGRQTAAAGRDRDR